jgi:ADP-ribosylglycohydrolase
MIRCDPFGWAAPANPALAARMAFEDARGSQTRNGIYGGIFFAVLLADIFAHGDASRAIQTARQYVPPGSRFAEMIDFTVSVCRARADWEQANPLIYARYHQGLTRSEALRWNHILPNAALTVMSLLYAGDDFGRAIGLATMAGMDTDCTAATAGSIMGVAVGAQGIPQRWQEPLNDTLRSQLVDLQVVKISEMAHRTYEIAQRYCRHAG